MSNGRMNFDEFDDEMDYVPREFSRGGKEKKKVLKMKKEFKQSKEKKGSIGGERRRYEKTYDEFNINID